MLDAFKLTEINPGAKPSVPTAAQIASGIPIPPVQLLQVFKPEQWEEFTEEWLSYHKNQGTYHSIRRYSGPGDLGLDVVAFTAEEGFSQFWDSFQCKHYGHALEPNDVNIEIAKIIYHSFKKTPPFNQAHRVPRKHLFVCPRGSGITVGRWFKDPERFKSEIRERWKTNGLPDIEKAKSLALEGDLEAYFDSFDFSIFGDKSAVELIEEHSRTQFHSARFGGGLGGRDPVPAPPPEPAPVESLYLRKLFDAYGECLSAGVSGREQLSSHSELLDHYDRQRVLFYNAEALRNFARDRTPAGTFDSLKDDIFYGVIDICEANHDSGLSRLRNTISTAGTVDVSGNALVGVTHVADKQGVCHHLANDDRLTWVKDNG